MRFNTVARTLIAPSFLTLAVSPAASFARGEPSPSKSANETVTLVNIDANGAIVATRTAAGVDAEVVCDQLVRRAYPATYSSDTFVCSVGTPARFVKNYDAPGYWFFK